jgi:hypothetical protein
MRGREQPIATPSAVAIGRASVHVWPSATAMHDAHQWLQYGLLCTKGVALSVEKLWWYGAFLACSGCRGTPSPSADAPPTKHQRQIQREREEEGNFWSGPLTVQSEDHSECLAVG